MRKHDNDLCQTNLNQQLFACFNRPTDWYSPLCYLSFLWLSWLPRVPGSSGFGYRWQWEEYKVTSYSYGLKSGSETECQIQWHRTEKYYCSSWLFTSGHSLTSGWRTTAACWLTKMKPLGEKGSREIDRMVRIQPLLWLYLSVYLQYILVNQNRFELKHLGLFCCRLFI